MAARARPQVCVQPDPKAVGTAAAEAAASIARQAVESQGWFTLALCGGTGVRSFLAALAEGYARALPWDRTRVFWSDERYVSPESAESNYGLAKRLLLDHVEIARENVHPMRTLLPSPAETAQAYEEELIGCFSGVLPRFDLVVLGMGPDGHTASLFPHSWALGEESRLVAAIEDAPKPPARRLTMTYPVLNNAANVFFLVSGAEKHDALERAVTGPEDRQQCPASAIRPVDGTLMWWVDQAAFGGP